MHDQFSCIHSGYFMWVWNTSHIQLLWHCVVLCIQKIDRNMDFTLSECSKNAWMDVCINSSYFRFDIVERSCHKFSINSLLLSNAIMIFCRELSNHIIVIMCTLYAHHTCSTLWNCFEHVKCCSYGLETLLWSEFTRIYLIKKRIYICILFRVCRAEGY